MSEYHFYGSFPRAPVELETFVCGEIFNVPEVATQLGLATTSPVEAVLALGWQQWSTGLIPRLEGVLSLAICDGQNLLLYRDPSGLRNVFWQVCQSGQGTFATSATALRKPVNVGSPIDRRGLHEYLRFLELAAPSTIWQGMRAIEPGQLLRLTDGEPHIESPAHRTNAVDAAIDFEAAVTELHQLLQDAVTAATGGTPRLGAFLSGGVDSALICALARTRNPALTALTVGLDGEAFDEAPVAARIAAHLGVEHHVLRFGRADYLRAFDRLARGMDQPMADPATMATVLAFDYCRERFDAVLDGTGADEAVGAMPPRHVRLAVGVGSLVPAPLRRSLVRALRHIPGLSGYTPILDFEHPAETLMRWKGFTRSEIEELCGEPVSLAHTTFYRTFARFPRRAHYERYSALLNAMPGDRLTQAMRLTGLNVRFPFFARDVDTFVRQLPTEWRHLPGQPKRILRELLARYVPRELWDAPKHGFDFPLQDFLAGKGFELVQRHVLNGRWLDRGLLRPDVVRRFARQYIDGDRRLMFRVWALVVLGAWLDAHEDLMILPPRA